jgi:hypothetical protein
MHVTAASSLSNLSGLGVATWIHLDPIQRSANVLLLPSEPTAQQLPEEVQLTARSSAPDSEGVCTFVQVVPFQRTASGRGKVWPLPMFPTAQQSVEEVQLTLSSAPAAAGDATATQLDPFQCSVSPTTLLVAVSSVEPTAQQSSAETQLTPERRLLPAGCGKLEATEAAASPGNTTAGAHAPTASGTAARAKPSLPCSEPNGPLSMP